MGNCQSDKFTEDDYSGIELTSTNFVYWACEDRVGANFSTGENFGCIHWQEKEV